MTVSIHIQGQSAEDIQQQMRCLLNGDAQAPSDPPMTLADPADADRLRPADAEPEPAEDKPETKAEDKPKRGRPRRTAAKKAEPEPETVEADPTPVEDEAAPEPEPEPEAKPETEVTLEQVRDAARALVKAKDEDALRNLIASYDAKRVSDIHAAGKGADFIAKAKEAAS